MPDAQTGPLTLREMIKRLSQDGDSIHKIGLFVGQALYIIDRRLEALEKAAPATTTTTGD